jgi:hypothetical protein
MALALALDGASVWLLAQARTAAVAPAALLGLHGAACVLGTLAVPGLLPPVYRKPSRAGLLFVLALTLAVPALGMLGIALALVPALWCQRAPAQGLDCLRAPVTTGLGAVRDDGGTLPATGEGRLMGILQCATERGSRLEALISTLSLDAQHAAPLLRIGLKDRDDDVRLLAYSLLTRKEKALEERIGKSLRRLDQEPPAAAFAVHRSLAHDYWELAGLGNASSSGSFLLERARAHAEAGIALQPAEAGLQLLLGRILLKKNALEAAHTALLRAVAGGVPRDKVAPFLAEIAFHQREFSEITRLLSTGKRAAPPFPLNRVATYWKDGQHAH